MTRERVALFLGPALLGLTLLTPAPGDLDAPAWRMAGLAFWMAAWWIGEAVPLAATALLPLVLYPLLDILPSAVTAREYGNHLIYLFLGGFLLAIAMERWNLHRRIALHVLLRFGTRPGRLLLGFALAVAFLSMWVSNTATTLMILPVATAVVLRLSEHARLDGADTPMDPARARGILGPVFMLTVAYAASAGGIATLVGTPPNIVLAGAITELVPDARTLGFARWMILGIPASLALLGLVLFWVPRLASPISLKRIDCGLAARELLASDLAHLGPMTAPERRVLAVFAATVLLWLTRAPIDVGGFVIPGWSLLLPNPDAVHDATVAVAAGIVLMALRVPDPQDDGATVPLLDWHSAREGVPWGVLLLFGGGFALARGFVETGLSAWLGHQLEALGSTPLPVVILAVCLLTTFLTEVTSNTATSTVLMPILAAAATAIGVAPPLLMIPAALSASCAFMLPVATPPNAIVFGSGWVTIPGMARTGLAMNLSGAVVLTLLCWALAPLVSG